LASPSEIESSSVDTTKLRFRLHAPDDVALISESIAQQKLDRPGLPVRSADHFGVRWHISKVPLGDLQCPSESEAAANPR
jgi:hypothetical protein